MMIDQIVVRTGNTKCKTCNVVTVSSSNRLEEQRDFAAKNCVEAKEIRDQSTQRCESIKV